MSSLRNPGSGPVRFSRDRGPNPAQPLDFDWGYVRAPTNFLNPGKCHCCCARVRGLRRTDFVQQLERRNEGSGANDCGAAGESNGDSRANGDVQRDGVRGTAPLSYQWLKNNANIGGATAASYTTPATIAGDNGAKFDVVVSNAAGSRHQRDGHVDGERGSGGADDHDAAGESDRDRWTNGDV